MIDFVVTDTSPGGGAAEGPSAQSTISRYACRILCDRRPPYTARIYAAGFDASSNIFLGVSEPPQGGTGTSSEREPRGRLRRGGILGGGTRLTPSHDLSRDLQPHLTTEQSQAQRGQVTPKASQHQFSPGPFWATSGLEGRGAALLACWGPLGDVT